MVDPEYEQNAGSEANRISATFRTDTRGKRLSRVDVNNTLATWCGRNGLLIGLATTGRFGAEVRRFR